MKLEWDIKLCAGKIKVIGELLCPSERWKRSDMTGTIRNLFSVQSKALSEKTNMLSLIYDMTEQKRLFTSTDYKKAGIVVLQYEGQQERGSLLAIVSSRRTVIKIVVALTPQ